MKSLSHPHTPIWRMEDCASRRLQEDLMDEIGRSYGGWCLKGGLVEVKDIVSLGMGVGVRGSDDLVPRRFICRLVFLAYSFSLISFTAACTARLCAFLGVSGWLRALTCVLASRLIVRKWACIGLCWLSSSVKLCFVTFTWCATIDIHCSAACSGNLRRCSNGIAKMEPNWGASFGGSS